MCKATSIESIIFILFIQPFASMTEICICFRKFKKSKLISNGTHISCKIQLYYDACSQIRRYRQVNSNKQYILGLCSLIKVLKFVCKTGHLQLQVISIQQFWTCYIHNENRKINNMNSAALLLVINWILKKSIFNSKKKLWASKVFNFWT